MESGPWPTPIDSTIFTCHSIIFQIPGAERLIRHLHKTKTPFALATSSSARSVDTKIAPYKELFSYFNHMVMGSTDKDVKFGKPHPDIFLVAAARFPDKPDPSKVSSFCSVSKKYVCKPFLWQRGIYIKHFTLYGLQRINITDLIFSLFKHKESTINIKKRQTATVKGSKLLGLRRGESWPP